MMDGWMDGSFAHMIGDQDFSMEHTAKGGFIIALFTQGEGYHNFVHPILISLKLFIFTQL
jgi:fatty-acid desaturase